MRIVSRIGGLMLGMLAAVQLHAQPRGEPIDRAGGSPNAVLKSATTNSLVSSNATQWTKPVYADFGFDRLSGYSLELTEALVSTNGDPGIRALIPPDIKAADGQKVTVEGFMVPVDYDKDDKVKSFVLARNQMMCCYGGSPQINEFVDVVMSGNAVKGTMDVPLRVRGTLHVGPHRDGGILVGIYAMDAEAVAPSGATK